MKDEIAAAVVFITKIVKRNRNLNPQQIAQFSECLAVALVSKFRNHWYEDNPTKGQAFRCIRIARDEPRDSVILRAATESSLDYYRDLNLPADMTLWVDPHEVVCRFGERGTHCTIASFPKKSSTQENEEEATLDPNGNPQINETRIPSPTKIMEQYGSSPPDYDYFHHNRRNDQRLSPIRPRSIRFTGDQFYSMHGSILAQA